MRRWLVSQLRGWGEGWYWEEAGSGVPLRLGAFLMFLTSIPSEKYEFHMAIYTCNLNQSFIQQHTSLLYMMYSAVVFFMRENQGQGSAWGSHPLY